jgi:hypothetical protein
MRNINPWSLYSRSGPPWDPGNFPNGRRLGRSAWTHNELHSSQSPSDPSQQRRASGSSMVPTPCNTLTSNLLSTPHLLCTPYSFHTSRLYTLQEKPTPMGEVWFLLPMPELARMHCGRPRRPPTLSKIRSSPLSWRQNQAGFSP